MAEKFFAPISGICSFGGLPIHEDLDTLAETGAEMAVLGVPNDLGTCWQNGSKFGPKRVRESSAVFTPGIDGCYDWERDETYLGDDCNLVDCGDVTMITGDLMANHKRTEEAVRKIVKSGAIPVVIGGDHAITIPVAQAMDSYKNICAIQFDAHLDWSYAPGGQKYSHNSPMRRISEMEHFDKMVQIGIRGMGSSRRSDFNDAREYGSVLISAKQANRMTAQEIAAMIPDADYYYVTIDIDGLDAGIAMATGTPAPGGLTYDIVNDTLYEICKKKGQVVGFDLVEVAPSCDSSEVTERTAAMLIINFMGYIMKAKKEREAKA